MAASEIEIVGIVGLGAMGAGIAQIAIEAGYETVGREVTDDLGEGARGRIAHFLQRKVDKGQVEDADREAALGRLTLTTRLDDLARCDLVVEAIVEDLEAKVLLLRELEKMVRLDAVLATKMSVLSATENRRRGRGTPARGRRPISSTLCGSTPSASGSRRARSSPAMRLLMLRPPSASDSGSGPIRCS